MTTPTKAITDIKDAVMNTDNIKEGLINASTTVGGFVIGGFLNKIATKVEFLSRYKMLVDGLLFLLSIGVQFVPAKWMPSWAKHLGLGAGCYSILALLSDIANYEKTPESIKNLITGYVPTITQGSSLSGMGTVSLADEWANQTAPSISETSSMQAAGSGGGDVGSSGSGLMNGYDRPAYLGN